MRELLEGAGKTGSGADEEAKGGAAILSSVRDSDRTKEEEGDQDLLSLNSMKQTAVLSKCEERRGSDRNGGFARSRFEA
jgi:hypothetical protein